MNNEILNEITDVTVFGRQTANGVEVEKIFLNIFDKNTNSTSVILIEDADTKQMYNLVQNIISMKKKANSPLNIRSYNTSAKKELRALEEEVDMNWSMRYAVNRYNVATIDKELVVDEDIPVKTVTVTDEANQKAKLNKKSPVGKVALAAAVAGTALAVACSRNKVDDNQAAQVAITQDVNNDAQETEEPVNENKEVSYENWDDYNANAPVTSQKDQKVKIFNYLNEFGSEESLLRIEISQEEVDEFVKAGYSVEQAEDGKYYATLNLTAKQAESLDILFGDYTNDEIAAMLGGKKIDSAIAEQGEGALNQAIRILIYKQLNTNQESINLDKLIKFDAKTQQANSNFEKLFFEHKTLLAEGKDQEAKEKMAELVEAFVNYSYSQNDSGSLGKNFTEKYWGTIIVSWTNAMGINADADVTFYNNKGEQKTINVTNNSMSFIFR